MKEFLLIYRFVPPKTPIRIVFYFDVGFGKIGSFFELKTNVFYAQTATEPLPFVVSFYFQNGVGQRLIV